MRPSRTAAVPRIVHQAIHSAGRPLDPATRAFFERRLAAAAPVPPLFAPAAPRAIDRSRSRRELEAEQLAERLSEPLPADPPARRHFDLSGVRVHTDSLAVASARRLHAAAYSVGHHIVFGAGQFRPETQAGRWLIAHELAHLTQPDAATVVGCQDAGVAVAPEAQASEPKRPDADAGTPVPRPDFVFIMGADKPGTKNPFYREAEGYYRAHLPAATMVTSVRNLSDLLSWLSTHAHGPVGNIYIVTHANEDGTVSFGLDPDDKDAHLSVQELRGALHRPSALPSVSGQVDAATRIHIKGCDLGRTQAMVELIDEAFGGAGTVTAPTHEQEYGEDPALAAQARKNFEAKIASSHPKVPGIDPSLRGAARTQAQKQRQQAVAQREQDIQAEIASRHAEEEQLALEASRYEAFSGPMFQRPGKDLFTRSELSPMVAAQYPQLSARQQQSLVSRLVAHDTRAAAVAKRQGTYQQHGQRHYQLVMYTVDYDDPHNLREALAVYHAELRARSFIPASLKSRSSKAVAGNTETDVVLEDKEGGTLTLTVTVPSDATMISEAKAGLPNPERYDWQVLEHHHATGKTTKQVIAERVIAYLHHASLDPSPHEHFTRPEDDPRFFATSTTPPASPPTPTPPPPTPGGP